MNILAGYAGDADDLITRFEALRTVDVLAPVMALLPTRASRILDVGAGTGRDAAWFAGHGHDVVAVEPVPELRRAGMDLHRLANLAWLDDSLPLLASVTAGGAVFDLIVAIGVWQHLRAEEQPRALTTLATLVAPEGRLIISVRHGPGAPTRPCFGANVDQMIGCAEGAGLKLLMRQEAESVQQQNRDAGVRWTWLCLERDREKRWPPKP
ncbi:MAG TPA: class I SAM-dependent methyltransferase [Allosphingosinicella sp.]|jgi:SAM-dependent methyltransferase